MMPGLKDLPALDLHDIVEELSCNEESEHIEQCLSQESFFNLSGKEVPLDTIEMLRKGGRYNPYVLRNLQKQKCDFNKEFCVIMNRLLKFIIPKKLLLDPKAIKKGVSKLANHFKGTGHEKSLVTLTKNTKKFWIDQGNYLKAKGDHSDSIDQRCLIDKF